MKFTSLPYALALGLGLAVACTNEVGGNPFDSLTGTTSSSSGTTTEPDTSGMTTEVDTGSSTVSTTITTTGADSGSSETTEDSNSGGAFCGDGMISGNEECDCGGVACTADGLDNMSCVDVSDPNIPGTLTGGTLDCNDASCRFDTAGCTYCGDGEINGIEGCEPDMPIPTTCLELGEGTAGVLTCDDACQIDTSGCTDCGYMFDFANCPAGWTTGQTTGLAAPTTWACGTPTGTPPNGPPGNPTGVWATNLTGVYSSDESGYLQSPALDLTACANESMTMTLTHWHNFEGGAFNADGGIVQVSTNGTNWTTLTPTGGSLYGNNVINSSYTPVDNTQGFDGQVDDNEANMLQSEFDLSPYAGDAQLFIRFVFGSDSSGNQAGWYIDAVDIVGSG